MTPNSPLAERSAPCPNACHGSLFFALALLTTQRQRHAPTDEQEDSQESFFLCRASRQPLCVLYCFCRRRAARKERDEARSAKPRLERAHGAGTRSFTLPIGKSPFVAGFPPFPHYSPFFFLAPAAARSPLFSTACSSSWLAFVLWRSPSVIYSSRKTRLLRQARSAPHTHRAFTSLVGYL